MGAAGGGGLRCEMEAGSVIFLSEANEGFGGSSFLCVLNLCYS